MWRTADDRDVDAPLLESPVRETHMQLRLHLPAVGAELEVQGRPMGTVAHAELAATRLLRVGDEGILIPSVASGERTLRESPVGDSL